MTRLEKIKLNIPNGVDALLVTGEINQYYLTGFEFTDGYVIITRSASLLLTDFRYIEAAKQTASDEFEVRMFEGKRSLYMKDIFIELGIKNIAFEDEELTFADLKKLEQTFADITFSPMGDIIDKMREFKDEGEISNIIAAQRIAERAFEHILGFINPERTEIDVALELEFFMRSHGAKDVSFKTIAVSGKASSLPHGEPRPVKLEKGFLTMDFGAKVNGYCSDMTRTVCLGKADAEMKRVYNTVLEAQAAAREAFDFGKTGGEVDSVARKIIDKSGYKGCFGHSLGHGVGLNIHETPRVAPGSDTVLTAGHVVTCEPGIYIEGKFGVRIEDMVVFHRDRIENITKATHELIEL